MSRIRWYGPTLLLLATVALSMAFGPMMVRQIARSYESAKIEQVRRDLVENPTLLTLSDAFKDVATVVRPSVASISLQARERLSGGRLVNISNGSGWVYRHFRDFENDPDDYADYIVTNHHVVEDVLLGKAEQIVVRFDDGGEYRARVVGTDPKTDIAVLKIKRQGLMPAALATEPAEQGEIVFAVGSPFQFEFSMSQGIVSATGRRLHARVNNYENFIQTDAAINPGNSGGPLTNVRGEVIGMNTAIAVEGNPAATFSGLGFAIPVDQIVNVVDQLIVNGEVRRGYMGVYITDVDFATARELGFEGNGVLCEPEPGGPADLAGIELGDIITHVNGRAVATVEELRIAVASNPPGAEVPVKVWRRGRMRVMRMTLVEDPRDVGSLIAPRRMGSPFEPGEDSVAFAAGLGRIESFTPRIASGLGWAYTPGVLVRLIEDRSPADRQGVLRMSVITEVNGSRVHDLESFVAVIEQTTGQTLTLTVKRWDPTGDGRYVEGQAELQIR